MSSSPIAISNNLRAFLDMIATSEGTTRIPNSDNGYRVIVGSTPSKPILMTGYTDHPRKLVKLNPKLSSTAAGRYQLLARYYDAYKKQLKLKDFSPASQDAIAIQQIRERKALDDIEAGRFDVAVNKVRNIWASLPGAGYGQHENSLERLRLAYVNAGGTLTG